MSFTTTVATAAGRSQSDRKQKGSAFTRMGLSPASIPDENSAAGTHRTHSAPRRSAGMCAENAGAIVEAAAVARRGASTRSFPKQVRCVRARSDSGTEVERENREANLCGSVPDPNGNAARQIGYIIWSGSRAEPWCRRRVGRHPSRARPKTRGAEGKEGEREQ